MPTDPDNDYYPRTSVEITALHKTLETKWKRKKRSPLKFVEAYDECARQVDYRFPEIAENPDDFSEIFAESISKLKAFLGTLESDYRVCVPLAEAQRIKNEYWRDIYDPPPRPWRG